jgi:hypothetical protein
VKTKPNHKASLPFSQRVRCPICKQAVYSAAGIHPQCAMSHPDAPGEDEALRAQIARMSDLMFKDRTSAHLAE